MIGLPDLYFFVRPSLSRSSIPGDYVTTSDVLAVPHPTIALSHVLYRFLFHLVREERADKKRGGKRGEKGNYLPATYYCTQDLQPAWDSLLAPRFPHGPMNVETEIVQPQVCKQPTCRKYGVLERSRGAIAVSQRAMPRDTRGREARSFQTCRPFPRSTRRGMRPSSTFDGSFGPFFDHHHHHCPPAPSPPRRGTYGNASFPDPWFTFSIGCSDPGICTI